MTKDSGGRMMAMTKVTLSKNFERQLNKVAYQGSLTKSGLLR